MRTKRAAESALIVSMPKRRRRINDDVVIARQHRSQLALEDELAGHHLLELELGRRQIDVRWRQVKAKAGLGDDRGQLGGWLNEDVVDALAQRRRVHANAEGTAGLGVKVNKQHPLTKLGAERRGEVDGRRRLGHAALLIGHDENAGTTIVFLLADEGQQIALTDAVAFADLDAAELALLDVASHRVRVQLEPSRDVFDREPVVAVWVHHKVSRFSVMRKAWDSHA